VIDPGIDGARSRSPVAVKVGDPFLLGGMVRPCFLLEGSSPVLEEFLLPAVEDRRLESYPSHQPKTNSRHFVSAPYGVPASFAANHRLWWTQNRCAEIHRQAD